MVGIIVSDIERALDAEHLQEDWLQRLQMLSARFSHLGIGDDLDGMSESELWSLYCFLVRS